MAIGDVWQVDNEFEYQGNANVYSWFLRIRAEGQPNLVETEMLDFGALRQTDWLPLHNPAVQFRCVTARQIYPDTNLPQQNIDGIGGGRTCTPAISHLPGQCCCVTTLYGDVNNPTGRNRGRDFVTGMCSDDQINGILADGPGNYLQELCDMYVAIGNDYVVGGNEYDVGVYSRSNAKPDGWPAVPSIEPFFWPLEHVRVRSQVRTQRRRQPMDRCEIVCDAAIT